jgi:uncharacterized protein
MLLPIKRISEGHSVLSQAVVFGVEEASWLPAKNLQCSAEIDRINSQLFIQVFYKGVVEPECSRCCKRFELQVQGDFRIVCEQKKPGPRAETEFTEDDIDIFFDDATDEIDITPLIYQEIMLEMPLKPLCSEDCSGGVIELVQDNIAESKPTEKETDPRWEALKKFSSKKE